MESVTPEKLQYSFTGKRVLITGGGRGLGYSLASRLYEDGASVFVLEKDAELVSKLRQDFPDKSKFRAEVCDISNWNETQNLIQTFGSVDHLVNCASIAIAGDILDLEETQVDKMFDVNLKSLLCVCQAVAKGMVHDGIRGTIVNMASIAGHNALRNQSLYCITKAGVIMTTKCLAVELGKHGIRVNSVSPTAIKTPMFLDRPSVGTNTSAEDKPFLARQPLHGKNILETNDVVNSILFLLSPLSSLANGMDLLLDGGILAC